MTEMQRIAIELLHMWTSAASVTVRCGDRWEKVSFTDHYPDRIVDYEVDMEELFLASL